MMTVNEVSMMTGVSIRTLQYYDKIDLLKPTGYTDAGYRLYDENALERLQQILLFRELEFPLKQIKRIINSKDFDKVKALEQQITLLEMKKEHIENLITLAREIKSLGVKTLDFKPFDTKKIDEYSERAKASWGNTSEYKEFESKDKDRTEPQRQELMSDMMSIFVELGKVKAENMAPESNQAQTLVKKLQDFITEHFYNCSDTILAGLGKMYCTEEFTNNIDTQAGDGTAAFTAKAIEAFVKGKV